MAANACVTEKAQSNAATSVVGSFVFSAAGCFILGRLWLSGVAAGAAGTARCMRLRRTGAVAPRLLAALLQECGAAQCGVDWRAGSEQLALAGAACAYSTQS